MPDCDAMVAVVHAYIDGFARGDGDALAALFAQDATVEDPVGTPPKRGIDEIRAFYAASVATGATLELLGEPRCAGDSVAFPFAVKLEWQGRRQVIEVIDTFRFDAAGKIAEMRAYFGPANMKSA
ncbi:MAG: nuclear transport factor 2 family protein [Sphingomonadales bacterium]|nr:nuclear transport factor 2 family protein [Sphingomonadales bacterium]